MGKMLPHIPMPFEEVIGDVLKVKPERKSQKKKSKTTRALT